MKGNIARNVARSTVEQTCGEEINGILTCLLEKITSPRHGFSMLPKSPGARGHVGNMDTMNGVSENPPNLDCTIGSVW